jgi:hypothetical protein
MTEGIENETIRESVRREDVAVDESGKTACPEKGHRRREAATI